MDCPVCTTEKLLMADRQGIEIDYCPKCRGVWLDRGELDKLIERSAAGRPDPSRDDDRRYGHDSDRHDRGGYRKKKQEGFLSDLFDF